MPSLDRRSLLVGLGFALSGCTVPGGGGSDGGGGGGGGGGGDGGGGGGDQPASPLNRFALTAAGAEVTGLFLGPAESLFMNVQHPDDSNTVPYDDATVGVFRKPLADLPTDFESVQVPSGTQERVSTSWGEYQLLMQGGDWTDAGEELGVAYDPDGNAITRPDSPDANVFVPTDRNAGYLFTNWETAPGMVSRLEISRPAPGEQWSVNASENLGLRSVDGTWRNCFGTRSPWGTPLSAEECYYQNTAEWNSPDPGTHVEQMRDYLGEYPNPYRYGYIVEFQEPKSADPTPVKQFAMGRAAHENAVVMPDERTVYLTDDGTGTVFFKFVADEAGDLSSGTLYAAKATQTAGSSVDAIGFDIEWIRLASATNSEVEGWIAEYDDVTQSDYQYGETSYVSDAEIEAWARGEAADDRAAFLESRKAAEAAGATAEFRKMEGVNVRPGAAPGDYLYLAMSAVTKTMADDQGDIRTPRNKYGAVYRMQLDSNYDVSHMEPIVTGGPSANVCGGCPYDAQPDSSDTCANCSYNPTNEETVSRRLSTENTIANPDNVVVMEDGRVVVGEDTGLHENDMVWVYTPPQ